MTIEVRAMPDRVVLRFPEAITDIRGVSIPESWALRREVGELVALGSPTSLRNWLIARHILGLTGNTRWQQFREKRLGWLNRLTGWKKPEARFLVSMALGTYYWRKELESFAGEFNFLRDLRVYNISELATAVSGQAPEVMTQPIVMEKDEPQLEIATPQLWTPR